MKEEITIKCTGCEAECPVCVILEDGFIVSLGGNDCPTGASYAASKSGGKRREDGNGTDNG